MPGSRNSKFPRTSVRHRSSWEVGPETSGGGGQQSLSSSIAQIAGTAVQATVDGQTLIRTRGELVVYVTAVTNSGEGFFGAFGIAKATSAAVLAGVASVPTPATEDAWDGWLYHRYLTIVSGGPIAAATAAQEQNQGNANLSSMRLEVDSKAMRKIDVNEAFYAVLEVTELGTATLVWHFNSRMLFKLMA